MMGNQEVLCAEKIAFFINVYNALIVHATVAHGVPANVVARLKFFRKANYVIGGSSFSADDMEHGVLRSNAVAPSSLGSLLGIKFLQKNQFPAGDPREQLSVSPLDPRIHFALVCGAKSCPPIKLYTPDNLDEGLQVLTILPTCMHSLSRCGKRCLGETDCLSKVKAFVAVGECCMWKLYPHSTVHTCWFLETRLQ